MFTFCRRVKARGEPRLELGVHVFELMWNYFGINAPFIYCLLIGNERGSGNNIGVHYIRSRFTPGVKVKDVL